LEEENNSAVEILQGLLKHLTIHKTNAVCRSAPLCEVRVENLVGRTLDNNLLIGALLNSGGSREVSQSLLFLDHALHRVEADYFVGFLVAQAGFGLGAANSDLGVESVALSEHVVCLVRHELNDSFAIEVVAIYLVSKL
jgi:hypothetical protein